MSTFRSASASRRPWYHRLSQGVLARIVVGIVVLVAPVALSMRAIQALIDKPYRQAWPQLLAAALCICAYCWFVRRFERCAVDELASCHAAREFSAGALLGFTMICAIAAILWFAGVLQFAGLGGGRLFAPFAEMVLAAVLEEIIFRGVLLRMLAAWLGVWKAVATSSLIFAAAHLPSEGFSAAAFVGIALAGALLSAAYLLHGRLWLPIGLHFGWNFTTTAVFGLASSGSASTGYFRTSVAGPEWLSGGGFGVEASVVTLVFTAALASALLVSRHRRQRVAGVQGR